MFFSIVMLPFCSMVFKLIVFIAHCHLVGAKIQLFSYNSLKSEENILILLSICDIHKKVKPIINFCLTLAKKAAKNNPNKFPEDYMFVLTSDESKDLRSKISTTNLSAKSRSLPKAFTEKGLYMLATILKSQRAKRIREPSPDPMP
jgi:hypothetical protein